MADFVMQAALEDHLRTQPHDVQLHDEPDGDEDPAGKVDAFVAGYRSPGHYPWTCCNCIHYGGHESEEHCAVVEGPWEGMVHADDDCRLFMPGSTLTGHEEEPEPDQNEEPGPTPPQENIGEHIEVEEAP